MVGMVLGFHVPIVYGIKVSDMNLGKCPLPPLLLLFIFVYNSD